MTLDPHIIVHFRRRRTMDEHRQDLDAGNPNPDLFAPMGQMLMTQVPDEGKYIFVNGTSYLIQNVTWSVYLPEPGESNVAVPEVMLTLGAGTDWNNPAAPRSWS